MGYSDLSAVWEKYARATNDLIDWLYDQGLENKDVMHEVLKNAAYCLMERNIITVMDYNNQLTAFASASDVWIDYSGPEF